MPSMSYCMVENTASELDQVVDSMCEDIEEFVNNMSQAERRSFVRLFDLCRYIVDNGETVQDLIEREE